MVSHGVLRERLAATAVDSRIRALVARRIQADFPGSGD
jgi:hypothetical protein